MCKPWKPIPARSEARKNQSGCFSAPSLTLAHRTIHCKSMLPSICRGRCKAPIWMVFCVRRPRVPQGRPQPPPDGPVGGDGPRCRLPQKKCARPPLPQREQDNRAGRLRSHGGGKDVSSSRGKNCRTDCITGMHTCSQVPRGSWAPPRRLASASELLLGQSAVSFTPDLKPAFRR